MYPSQEGLGQPTEEIEAQTEEDGTPKTIHINGATTVRELKCGNGSESPSK
jgi:hypothetical protein